MLFAALEIMRFHEEERSGQSGVLEKIEEKPNANA